ncbi:hypothetical protein Ddc_16496 [Ditylenchus destructor]|nr:hypothetical protein Ddc_16496 [Ditylenchus destructor]
MHSKILAKMRALRSTRIITESKRESDRIAREEAYASEIPGLTHIETAENNTKDQCDFIQDGCEFNTTDHFRGRLSRTEQMRTHAGDRRFKCKKCKYAANWRSNPTI